MSRITSISIIAYISPHWSILACFLHIIIMTCWLQLLEKPLFCSHNKICELAFSMTLGSVYLFTYILPVEGKTRYRYSIYYTICFLQNLTCALIWFFYANKDIRMSIYFYPILVFSFVPFVLGLIFMLIYYGRFHPKTCSVSDVMAEFKHDEVEIR